MPMVVVALCRAGFEREAALDLAAIANAARLAIRCETTPGEARVVAHVDGDDAASWHRAAAGRPPVFVRTWFAGTGAHVLAADGDRRPDRIAALVAAFDALARMPGHEPPWLAPWIEYPDTNEGKALSPLAQMLDARLAAALRERGLVRDGAATRAHVSLVDGRRAYVGTCAAGHEPRWPLGIPRLRMPREAPSRSTLKLAEAIAVFLGPRERELLHIGQAAVDLGAAPGGWTWQLVARGLQVTAVDHGALSPALARDVNVEHVRADGFAWRPRRPVDWLVCDIVERPSRVASLVADWIASGATARAVFNLKLPMKSRHDEVARCEAQMRSRFESAGVDATVAFRHLYHDREEVTGYVEAGGRGPGRRRDRGRPARAT